MKKMMKNIFNVFFTMVLIVGTAVSTESIAKEISLTPPAKGPKNFISTPVKNYYIDMASIHIHQNGSRVLAYDMVTNLTEGSNELSSDAKLFTQSMRSHKLLNCESGKRSVNGITVYSEFFGLGQEITKIPQSLKWELETTVFDELICAHNNQNFKGKSPEEVFAELDELVDRSK